MAPKLRERWAEQLPGPTDTTPEAATALLRALPGDGFSPPAERVAAANALAGASVPVGRDAEVERLLRAELDAFASGYWELAPSDRLMAWADLSRRGADAMRLRELEPGLDVSVPALGDPTAEALADLIRGLFVQRPRVRSVSRNTWLLDHVAEAEKWRAALAVVQRDAPALIALEPQLRAALVPGFPLAAFVAGVSAAPVQATKPSSVVARDEHSRSQSVQPSSTGGGWGGGSVFGGGAVFVLFAVVKLFSLIGRSDNPSKYTPPPVPHSLNFSVPAASTPSSSKPPPQFTEAESAPSSSKPLPQFTEAEVAEFKRYEQEQASGNSPRKPLAYDMWFRAGRPPGEKQPKRDLPSYSFARQEIELCIDYDNRKTRVKPAIYDRWVAADKPLAPGTYTLIHPLP